MSYKYAIVTLDGYNNLICTGTLTSPNPVETESYIPTEEAPEECLGKMWTGELWVENPNPPVIEV